MDAMAKSRWSAMAITSGLVMVVGAFMLLSLQIEVTDPGAGSARSCGSAFDAAVDRSGWQVWWDQDLEDPDVGAREALLRTNLCPSAVNSRLVVAWLLATVGFVVTIGIGNESQIRR